MVNIEYFYYKRRKKILLDSGKTYYNYQKRRKYYELSLLPLNEFDLVSFLKKNLANYCWRRLVALATDQI